MENFKVENNYIGVTPKHKKMTNWIYKRYCQVNYTAYIHDNLYNIMKFEKYLINQIISKIFFDIIFLIMGILRSLSKAQLGGLFIIVILYVILFVSTPYYFTHLKNKNEN